MPIVVLVGENFAGKSTIGNALVDSGEATYVPSYTTREIRENEEASKRYEYYHFSDEEFEEMKNHDHFEWIDQGASAKYGTTKKNLDLACQSEKPMIMIIRPTSLKRLKEACDKRGVEVKFFYIERNRDISVDEIARERGMPKETVEAKLQENETWREQLLATGLPFIEIENKGSVEELINNAKRIITNELTEMNEAKIKDPELGRCRR